VAFVKQKFYTTKKKTEDRRSFQRGEVSIHWGWKTVQNGQKRDEHQGNSRLKEIKAPEHTSQEAGRTSQETKRERGKKKKRR